MQSNTLLQFFGQLLLCRGTNSQNAIDLHCGRFWIVSRLLRRGFDNHVVSLTFWIQIVNTAVA